ncbi:dipeptidyl-peptidase 3 family protein [Parvularcula dongshanensis]|uniref:Zn-dependent hydrolase n=1 Tax=Parvularcula dongshanensis TaxID=1173995 RepID=A0A840I548_9PROT|nr:hypothetical protein [Parvularcula dongshanensis]MBB4659502.1 hypothetical protein [Parvularcula dongshanensis]
MIKPRLFASSLLVLGLVACGTDQTLPSSDASTVEAGNERLATIRDEVAVIEMHPDTAFLSAEERQVVNLLIDAANLMSEIYLRQSDARNPGWREEIEAAGGADAAAQLALFDRYFGPWDPFEEDEPFWGDEARPLGAGFYPVDLTREELDAYLEAHPGEREAILDPYTVVRREGDRLVATPYSKAYAEFLEPAAEKLRQAAEVTTNDSLKRFLTLRAESFLSDDYYESEMAWMDLEGPIEVAIGPYEVYTDQLMGQKTAFEAFITVRNPERSAALDKYKSLLRDMEANLPVAEGYKNFSRGFESPIAVVDQVHGGGDNVPGVQTIAFNLPNDERVREAKGAKKVLLDNVMGAKFDRILAPMAERVLVPEQAALLMQEYMGAETLFHELSHSLGPGSIVVDGRQTTVNAALRELYSATEEGKADVMGAWNILYMMDRGEMPAEERENFLATYVTGLFRAMRFGIGEAHGRGAAFQYDAFREAGALTPEPGTGLYRIDFERLETAIRDLTAQVVTIQGDGDYEGARAFLEGGSSLDAEAQAAIERMTDIPVDIQPVYPEAI